MSEIKPGEQVHLAITQIDGGGFRIMDLEARWYGFDNETANRMGNDLVDAVQERTKVYSEAKNA